MTVYKSGRRIFSPEEQAAAGAEILGGMVARQVDKQSQLQKTPTIPIYDSTNWPDDAVDGQIVRDKNDLNTLWQYQGEDSGGDNEWHKIAAGESNVFPRFFNIRMSRSINFPRGLYSGFPDRAINWKTDPSGPAISVWTTNDTNDGSLVSRSTIEAEFTEGQIFEYDWPTSGDLIKVNTPGAYLIQGYVDLRPDSLIDTVTIDSYHVLGIAGQILGIIQQPQKQVHEDYHAYARFLRVDITRMGLLMAPASASIALTYGHQFELGSTVRFESQLSVVWLGPFVQGLQLGY